MSQALWMLVGFPLLQKRLGTGTLLRICVAVQPLLMVQFPVFNELLRHGYERAFWVAFWPSLAVGSGCAMMFGKP